jgi:hypothetical protein
MSYNSVRRRGRERIIGQNRDYFYCGMAPFALSRCWEFFSFSAVAPASAFRRKVKHHAM